MAKLNIRKLSIYLILSLNIAHIRCDDEDYHNNEMRNSKDFKRLLRGSNDGSLPITKEELLQLEKDMKDFEIDETIESDDVTTVAALEDTNAPTAITEESTELSKKMDAVAIDTTVVPDEAMLLDNDSVDKHIDASEGQDVGNRSGEDVVTTAASELKMDTTTHSIEVADEGNYRMAIFNEDNETIGLRNPKTDDTEEKTPLEKRNFGSKVNQHPSETRSKILQSWLNDEWLRSPPGILVPLRPGGLKRALDVWNDLIGKEALQLNDVVFIGYDSNGVTWRSRHNLVSNNAASGNHAVSDTMAKLLAKYQVNSKEQVGDGTMAALASSAKLVPYDSAIFVITDKKPDDLKLLPTALRALVEKRLKVYIIWTDPNFFTLESEKALETLRNISTHTEGDVLIYPLEEGDPQWFTSTENYREAKKNRLTDELMETLLVHRGGGGASSVGVPVESGVSGLRIYIEGAVEHAVIYPPNDAPQIDLYNLSSVKAFSPASRTDGLSPRDVYIIFPGAKPEGDTLSVLPMATPDDNIATESNIGTWHLSVRCDTCDYRVTVSAYAKIKFHAALVNEKSLFLQATGPLSTIRETTLVDEHGNELSKLNFIHQPAAGEDATVDPDQVFKAEVPYPRGITAQKVFAKIVGRDVKGESYSRYSGPLNQKKEARISRSASVVFPDTPNDLELTEEVNQRLYDARYNGLFNDTNILPNNRANSQIVNQRGSILTAVQIGLSTRLYGAPGDNLQLHFEVTNYREQAVYFRFEAVGELRFLRGITPTAQTIAAGQTVNVVVSLTITATATPGARDLITFTAYSASSEQVSISTYVYVMNSDTQIQDVWPPTLSHNFQGSCIGRTGEDCVQHAWSARIIAQDAIGGLLRISSVPIGIIYDSNFIAGTREPVYATYRATCCAPRVAITAVDSYGNANSYIVDISNYFTPAGIAAIVLGVFLFIALVLLIVFLVYWCVRRRKESRELPYTASSRASRREIN